VIKRWFESSHHPRHLVDDLGQAEVRDLHLAQRARPEFHHFENSPSFQPKPSSQDASGSEILGKPKELWIIMVPVEKNAMAITGSVLFSGGKKHTPVIFMPPRRKGGGSSRLAAMRMFSGLKTWRFGDGN